MKRTLFALLFASFLFGAGWAAAAGQPIVGDWECVVTTPGGGEMNMVLTVTERDGKLAGNISGEHGSLELIDPKLEKDIFMFRVLVESEPYDVQLKVSGSKLEGSWKGGGQAGQFRGSRKA